MEGKTNVEITQSNGDSLIKSGSQGYIDGYVCDSNGIPCAVVVCDEKIDFIPIWGIRVI